MLYALHTASRDNNRFAMWCARPDSNRHAVKRQDLNLVRLPISPSPHEQRILQEFRRVAQPLRKLSAGGERWILGLSHDPAGFFIEFVSESEDGFGGTFLRSGNAGGVFGHFVCNA